MDPHSYLTNRFPVAVHLFSRGLSNIHDLIRVLKVISPPIQAVRVVEQWRTSRVVGELHVISETWGLFQVVLLVLVVRVVKQ